MRGGGEEAAAGHPVLYCVIPRELAGKLHQPLRRHFSEDPAVEVVVERRAEGRRGLGERRRGEVAVDAGLDRRRIRAPEGRRVADRRAVVLETARPPLPRRIQRYAERLVFFERLVPNTQAEEDVDTARLV